MKKFLIFLGVIIVVSGLVLPYWIFAKINKINNKISYIVQNIPNTTVGGYSLDITERKLILYNVVSTWDDFWLPVPDAKARVVYLTFEITPFRSSKYIMFSDIRIEGFKYIEPLGFNIATDFMKDKLECYLIGEINRLLNKP